MKSKEFLTTKVVAKMCELSIGSVQKMVDQGIFTHYLTLGGHRRVSAFSVAKYLEARDKQLSKGKQNA